MIYINNDQHAVLDIPLNAGILKLFHELNGPRSFNDNGRLAFVPTKINIAKIEEVLGEQKLKLPSRSQERDIHESSFKGASVKDKAKFEDLYDHQIEALKKMQDNFENTTMLYKENFALFSEQGTGKTRVALKYGQWMFENKYARRMLVIAPKGVHRQWVESMIPESYNNEDKSKKFNYSADWYKSTSEKITSLNNWIDGIPNGQFAIFTINYEALNSDSTSELILKFMLSSTMIVFDESHYAKNDVSSRWINSFKITRVNSVVYKLLCSGTPLSVNLVDEWAQFKLLDKDIIGVDSKSVFRKRYCIRHPKMPHVVVGHRNLAEFKEKTQPYIYRATKEDLGIEKKNYSEFKFDLTKEQRSLIKDARNKILEDIMDHTIKDIRGALQRCILLQNISNGFFKDSEGKVQQLFNKPLDNPRIVALMEVLDAMPENSQAIIWCRFVPDVNIIKESMKERNLSYVIHTGQIRESEQKKARQDWLEHKFSYLIGTTQSMAEGHNLQLGGCTQAIYYSNSELAIKRWQSEDRIHRIGTKGICTFTDLLAEGCRDYRIRDNLKNKKDLSNASLGDIVEELRSIL